MKHRTLFNHAIGWPYAFFLLALAGCSSSSQRPVPPPPEDPEIIFDDPDCMCCTPAPKADEGGQTGITDV